MYIHTYIYIYVCACARVHTYIILIATERYSGEQGRQIPAVTELHSRERQKITIYLNKYGLQSQHAVLSRKISKVKGFRLVLVGHFRVVG